MSAHPGKSPVPGGNGQRKIHAEPAERHQSNPSSARAGRPAGHKALSPAGRPATRLSVCCWGNPTCCRQA